MTNLLFAYDLLGFVDGSRPCLPPTNPEHRLWLRQAHLVVLLGIQATVHSAISPTKKNCQASANRSNTRMLTLLTPHMRTIKKYRVLLFYCLLRVV